MKVTKTLDYKELAKRSLEKAKAMGAKYTYAVAYDIFTSAIINKIIELIKSIPDIEYEEMYEFTPAQHYILFKVVKSDYTEALRYVIDIISKLGRKMYEDEYIKIVLEDHVSFGRVYLKVGIIFNQVKILNELFN